MMRLSINEAGHRKLNSTRSDRSIRTRLVDRLVDWVVSWVVNWVVPLVVATTTAPLVGCLDPIGPDVRLVRQPVMVGPVERIGEAPRAPGSMADADERVSCEREIVTSYTMHATSSGGGEETTAPAARVISRHLGVPGRRARVREMRATARGHFSIFAVVYQSIALETEIIDDGVTEAPNEWDPCLDPE